MENISNEKIEKLKADMGKTKADIDRSKAKTAEYQAKYREQEKQLAMLEAFEIAARYRDLIGNEDFAAQLKQNQAARSGVTDDAADKEEISDANY
jgi:hypothetical protein